MDEYRIYGSELSPYSVKVRSYFRYKGIPHRWILRSAATEEEYRKHARLPLIPLVVTPGDGGIQDSTPILERLEGEHPEPSIHPEEATARFVSALVEELADEWGNKWMFHYRWARDVDRDSAAARIARQMLPDGDDETVAGMAAQIRERMVGRVWFVGSSPENAPLIEESFREAIGLLDTHLAARPYLFGGRPSFGDFGLWGQLYCAWTDPTPGALIGGQTPHLLAWIHRMTWPRLEGAFEPWGEVAPTLRPVLERFVGGLFVPWTLANEAALSAGEEELSVTLRGRTWKQKPQKYHAKSLAALRERYAAVPPSPELDELLESTGCLAALRP